MIRSTTMVMLRMTGSTPQAQVGYPTAHVTMTHTLTCGLDPVISSVLHPSGVVLATCSAPNRSVVVSEDTRSSASDSSDSEPDLPMHTDNELNDFQQGCLKLWSLDY